MAETNKNKNIATPPPSKRKAKLDRVDRAIELYVEGHTETSMGLILKAEYKLSPDLIKQAIATAREHFAAKREDQREFLTNKMSDMYMDLYRKAKQAGHYKTCNDILDNFAKINKLYEPKEGDKFIANITYSMFDPKKEETK